MSFTNHKVLCSKFKVQSKKHEKDFDDNSLGGIGIDACFGTEGKQELGWLSYHSGAFHISKGLEQYVLRTAYRNLSQGDHPAGFQQMRIRGKI